MKYDFMLAETKFGKPCLNIIRTIFPLLEDGPDNIVWLDIECEKVQAPPEGWYCKIRTKAFMVGMAYCTDKYFFFEVVTGNEEKVMEYVGELTAGKNIVYIATRDYDRMVLEGKWTNVRRAMATVPGTWPTVDHMLWENLNKSKFYYTADVNMLDYQKGFDVLSKEVPQVWHKDPDIVVLHNFRDLLEMALRDTRAPRFSFPMEILESDRYIALDLLDKVSYKIVT